MSDDSFNWDNAVKEWQNLQPDMPGLKKNMRWLAFRMKLILALDVLSLLVLVPFTYFIFLSQEPLSVKLWFSMASVIAGVGVYFDFYLRKDLWQQPETTREVFSHLVSRAKAGIKIASFAKIYMTLFLLFLIGWSVFVHIYEPDRLQKSGSLIALVCAGLITIISIAVAIWYGKRKRKQLAIAEKNYNEFIQAD